MTTPLVLACGNSMMETDVVFTSAFSLGGFAADLVLWGAVAAFVVMGVFPAMAKASVARQGVLVLGLLGVLVLVGAWGALGPVIARTLSGAAECTLSPGPLLFAAIAAPVLFVMHVGVLGLIRRVASPAALGVVVVVSSLVVVLVATIARENTTLPALCETARQAHVSTY